MTELLRLFQRIAAAVDTVLSEEANSQEIQSSAIKLGQTIKPCFEELRRSASALENLLQPCFDELAQAEAVWNSKPQIAKSSAIEIREHLGQITGSLFKLQRSQSQLIQKVTEETRTNWQNRVETIKKRWFFDQKSSNLKAVNLPDKEAFIQALNEEIQAVSADLCSSLKKSFQPIQTQLQQLQLNTVNDYLNLLDAQSRLSYETLLKELNLAGVSLRLSEPYDYLPDGTQNLIDTVALLIEKLIDQGFIVNSMPGKGMIKSFMGHGILPLTWENFSQFSRDVDAAIKQVTSAIISDRVELILGLLNQSIRFYDDFLEKQQRYQQETAEQRGTEQNWLAARRQNLEKVKNDVVLVLNSAEQANF